MVRAVIVNLEKSWNLNDLFPSLKKSWKSEESWSKCEQEIYERQFI